jgi:hypothetical protein
MPMITHRCWIHLVGLTLPLIPEGQNKRRSVQTSSLSNKTIARHEGQDHSMFPNPFFILFFISFDIATAVIDDGIFPLRISSFAFQPNSHCWFFSWFSGWYLYLPLLSPPQDFPWLLFSSVFTVSLQFNMYTIASYHSLNANSSKLCLDPDTPPSFTAMWSTLIAWPFSKIRSNILYLGGTQ